MEKHYYLHFEKATSLESVSGPITFQDITAEIRPVFNSGFSVKSDMSLSELRYILKQSFVGVSFAIIKVKNGSECISLV